MRIVYFILLLSAVWLEAGTITVSATVDGKGFKAKKTAKVLAQQEAVKNYAVLKNKDIPTDILNQLAESYSEYVMFTTQNQIDYNKELKKTTVNYTVEIDDQLFNKKIASMGLSVQGRSTKLVIIEEPLDIKNIDFFTDEDFVIYYPYLQQKIQETINSKLSDNGFKITRLEKEKKFESFKKRSKNLSGVYYDTQRSKYIQDRDFISQVIEEYPEVIFVKYRLEFLILADLKITAKISMKISDVEGNSDISLGDLSYSTPLFSMGYNSIINGFSQSVKNIISLLTNQVNEKVDEVIINKNNKPLTFIVNLPDRRSAFKTKEKLKTLNDVFNVVLQNNEIIFHAKKVDRDEFLYTKLLPAVEDVVNNTIPDRFIHIKSKKVIINTSGKEFNNDIQLQILYI